MNDTTTKALSAKMNAINKIENNIRLILTTLSLGQNNQSAKCLALSVFAQ